MPLVPSSRRQIGLPGATALVVSSMIGTGVFTTSGFALELLGRPGAVLVVWAIGGLIATCGAIGYGALARRFPESGGEYALLSRTVHPLAGFLAGWVSLLAGFTAPIAASALALQAYLAGIVQGWAAEWLATAAILAAALLHGVRVRVGVAFQVAAVGIELALIAAFLVLGAWALPAPHPIALSSPGVPAPGAFAVALVWVSFAYSGWNAAIYVASDVKQPGRFLPLSLILGTLLVILLYAPLNAVFLFAAPISELKGQLDVGFIAANHIFGGTGGLIMGLLISTGLISAISSMVWAGPRVTQVMGEDVRLLRALSVKNANGVPHVSLAFQYVLVVGLIITSTFDSIVNYIGFILSLSAFMTVAGVFVLRRAEPQLPRPYRVWGYPVTPLIFLAVTGWMMFFVVKQRPMVLAAGAATLAAGLVVYFVNQALAPSAAPGYDASN